MCHLLVDGLQLALNVSLPGRRLLQELLLTLLLPASSTGQELTRGPNPALSLDLLLGIVFRCVQVGAQRLQLPILLARQ